MFEAECNKCEAVYTLEDESVLECFECLCGCNKFETKKATLVVSH
jgi:hypothetical protein